MKNIRSAGADERCSVLLAWLESGDLPPGSSTAARPNPNARLRIFLDDAMRQAWGTTYDAVTAEWWKEQYDKYFLPCVPRPGRGDRAATSAIRRFAPYRAMIDEALGGERGRFTRDTVIDYVERGRGRTDALGDLAESIAAIPATIAGFERLIQLRREAIARLRDDTALRQQAEAMISERERAIAPAVLDEWIGTAATVPKTITATRQWVRDRNRITGADRALDAAAQGEWRKRYEGQVWSMIEADARAVTAPLDRLQPTIESAIALTLSEHEFNTQFDELRWLPQVADLQRRYAAARPTLFANITPLWEGGRRPPPRSIPGAGTATPHERAMGVPPHRR